MSNQNSKYGGAVSATINGILDLFKKREPAGILRPEDRIDGRSTIVTGASSGLGLAAAIELARRGGDMILFCRSKLEETVALVKKESGSEKVRAIHVDLADGASHFRAIEELKQHTSQVDIAVLNAGMVPSGSRITESGLDEMFTVNYLAKQLWIEELLASGLISSDHSFFPRIIFVSSESHRSSSDLQVPEISRTEEYGAGKVISLYGRYKLALNTLASELDRRENTSGSERFQLRESSGDASLGVFALCPGPVASNIARESPSVFKPLLKVVFGAFFRSPKRAAEPLVYLACSPDLERRSGVYLHLMTNMAMDSRAVDPSMGKRLWEHSASLISRMRAEQPAVSG